MTNSLRSRVASLAAVVLALCALTACGGETAEDSSKPSAALKEEVGYELGNELEKSIRKQAVPRVSATNPTRRP